VRQIDVSHVLEDREAASPVRRKGDLWRSIVKGHPRSAPAHRHGGRGDYAWAVGEAVGPDETGIDPIRYM
jgi:hypothetical protein